MCCKKDPVSFDCSCLAASFTRFPRRNRFQCLGGLCPIEVFLLLSWGCSRREILEIEMGFFEKILVIDWKEESDPLFEDFAIVPLLALFFPIVQFFLDRFVFEVFRSDSFCFLHFLVGFVLVCCLVDCLMKWVFAFSLDWDLIWMNVVGFTYIFLCGFLSECNG